MLKRLWVPIMLLAAGLLLYFSYVDVSNAIQNTAHKTCKATTNLNMHNNVKQNASVCD